MKDYQVVIEVISIYLDSINCKYNGTFISKSDIRYKLYHTMKDRNLKVPDITLRNIYILKIIMDTIDNILTFSHEYNDNMFEDGYRFFGSRFDYPDYMFPSIRAKIKCIITDVEIKFIENKFGDSFSINDSIDINKEFNDVVNGISCIKFE